MVWRNFCCYENEKYSSADKFCLKLCDKNWSKNVTQVDTSNFALKTNLASLKTEVDKLDINKLVPVPVDLSKLSDVVKNEVVKKTVYEKLAAKVNYIELVILF